VRKWGEASLGFATRRADLAVLWGIVSDSSGARGFKIHFSGVEEEVFCAGWLFPFGSDFSDTQSFST